MKLASGITMTKSKNNESGQASSGGFCWKFAVGVCICLIASSSRCLSVTLSTSMKQSVSKSAFTVPNHHSVSSPVMTTKVDHNLTAALVDDPAMGNGRKPSIVFLAGPHKTGSTTTNVCMADWTVQGSRRYLPNWSWPIPSSGDLTNVNLRPCVEAKAFSRFINVGLSMYGRDIVNRKYTVDPNKVLNASAVVDLYRKSIQKWWTDGYNIVLGTESLDFALGEFADPMKDLLMSVLPSSTLFVRPFDPQQDNVEVVVNYRTPRVDHLKSVWHQIANSPLVTPTPHYPISQETDGYSFKKFLLTHTFRPIFSLDLALTYLERGFNTTIVNQVGMKEEDRDLCHVIACDIMKENCTQRGYLSSVPQNETKTELRNVRTDAAAGLNMTNEQLSLIDDAVLLYDCGLKQELEKYVATKQLHVLFRQHHFLDNCPSNATKQSVEWLEDKIREIVAFSI